VHLRGDTSINSYIEWGITNIETMDQRPTTYLAFANGILSEGAKLLGNYKTRQLA
jgi:hypothetical protein